MTSRADKLELIIAPLIGLFTAVCFSPNEFGSADGILATLLSLAVAGVFPAVVLTASSVRPRTTSIGEAYRIGSALKEQVNFWVGILIWGSLSTMSLFIAHALSWTLQTPRLAFAPDWIPREGGRWLIFMTSSLTALTGLRITHVRSEIRSIVDLYTRAHVEAIKVDHHADEAKAREALTYIGPARTEGPEESVH